LSTASLTVECREKFQQSASHKVSRKYSLITSVSKLLVTLTITTIILPITIETIAVNSPLPIVNVEKINSSRNIDVDYSRVFATAQMTFHSSFSSELEWQRAGRHDWHK